MLTRVWVETCFFPFADFHNLKNIPADVTNTFRGGIASVLCWIRFKDSRVSYCDSRKTKSETTKSCCEG